MKNLRIGAIVVALLVTLLTSVRIYIAEQERRALTEDTVELSKIKYGLFSVDEWTAIISDVLASKIQEFDFEEADREEMRIKITEFLYKVVEEFEDNFYEDNSKGIGGFLRSSVAGITNMFGQIRKEVPQFTDQILDFMDDPENREDLRNYIMDKISGYADRTFGEVDYTTYNAVISKYASDDRTEVKTEIAECLDTIASETRPFAVTIFVLVLLLTAFLVLVKQITRTEYLLLTLICFALLLAGVMLPMIDIDARIAEMSFTLLGEPVAFEDQVLFYKSKSILEVTQLMLTQGKADLLAVGLLIFSFSVLFPFLKLTSSLGYLYRQKLRSSKFIQFLVFRTGKWSMADVMVVAIFMAFIGFRGIVSEQLNQFRNAVSSMDIVATNQSNLQLGFYLFTSFALLSLLVAHRLQYSLKSSEHLNTSS